VCLAPAICAGGLGCGTPTPTLVASPTPVATTPPVQRCRGDCDGSTTVAIDELILGVNIALGLAPVSRCQAFDGDGTSTVSVDEVITAVAAALDGCPA
jgi:hypothetical protein